MADRIRLGNATLTRVLECQVDDLPVAVFPKTPPDAWFELADEFAPTFWNDDRWRIALQVWVVEVDGLTVLVDTGVGNDRVRPRMRQLDHLQTDFLESLRRAGIEPEDVDVVINTHLHFDHVGWNTMRDGDAWVPTFPNARYLMPEADYRHFNPDGPVQTSRPRTEEEDRCSATCERCSRTAFPPWNGRSNYGPTTISSLRRLGFVRRRATPREPRWCGSTPASLRCSLAT